MVKSCVAANCTNKASSTVSLFRFPSNPHLRKQWIEGVQRTRTKWAGPTEHLRPCNAHFQASDFETNLYSQFGIPRQHKLVLKAGTVPSLFPRDRHVNAEKVREISLTLAILLKIKINILYIPKQYSEYFALIVTLLPQPRPSCLHM